MENSPGVLIIGLITLAAFGGLGAFLIMLERRNRKKADQTKTWPAADGTIVESDVKEHISMEDMDGIASTTYEPVVKYTYTAAGQTYTGGRINYGPNQSDSGTARKTISRYPLGSTVSVRYDPQNPAEAVLETNAAGSKLFMIIGIMFLVLGVCLGCGMMAYWLVSLL